MSTERNLLEVHYKLFGTDGVSLQSQELSRALSGKGWRVLYAASDVPSYVDGLHLPELSYQSAEAVALRGRLFPTQAATPDAGSALVEEVTARARTIRERLETYVREQGIRVLHVRNLMSLPYNLPASLAIFELATAHPELAFLLQHHDLYWEGPNARTFETPYTQVRALLERIMCPRLPNASHVLINPIAAEALRVRTGIEGTVIPDGFDFERRVPVIDERQFRSRLQLVTGEPRPLTSDDLIVSMPARVAVNKAIELAIQFVAALQGAREALEAAPNGLGMQRRGFRETSRVVLLLPQGEDIDDSRQYFERLAAYARHMSVTLAYGGAIVVPDRRLQPGDADHFPFYGTYRTADLVCYSPEHEGFGNQAIETVWARRPLAVLEYPVFKRFLSDHIPYRISLGDTEHLQRLDAFGGLHQLAQAVLDQAVNEAVRVLTDHELEQRWTDENFTALRAFCDIGRVSDTYIRLYEQLLNRAG